MAKKKKTTPPGLPDMMNLDNATTAALIQNIINMNSGRTPKKWTKKELENIFTFKDPNGLTDTQIKLMVAGAIFLQNDITPDIYKTLYEIASKNEALKILPIDAIFGMATGNDNPFFEGDYEEDDDDYDDDDYSAPGFPPFGFPMRHMGLTGKPLSDADKKSLLLKIQLRSVTKPPLWREVRVPANINFQQLHKVIQILFGWTDTHLWQFEEKPYGHSYVIGPELDTDSPFTEPPTDIASQTPITKVLRKEGDKMIYLYDFGDDWVHDISVKQVIEESTTHPICTKWKSDNPMEDIGGIWGLMELRQMADPKINHTKAEIKEFLDNHWYDSMDDFKATMKENQFDETHVNQQLTNIKP
jgi:hypothetical protein